MTKPRSVESMLPLALLGMTAVTGPAWTRSASSSLGRVFAANMTGNVVFIAFAAVGVPGLSLARPTAALLAGSSRGTAVGGRIMARAGAADAQTRAALTTFALEAALLVAASGAAIGFTGEPSSPATQLYALIVLTALAMGIRNASVRKLGVPDLTTTVLTLTLTGLAAESTLAGGANPGVAAPSRVGRRDVHGRRRGRVPRPDLRVLDARARGRGVDLQRPRVAALGPVRRFRESDVAGKASDQTLSNRKGSPVCAWQATAGSILASHVGPSGTGG